MHRHTACEQWAVEILHCTAPLPGGSGTGTAAKHRHIACGRWAVVLLDGCPQWRGLTGWGDSESSLAGGCSSRCG